jgi:serine/threonine-protein kinase RsbW
VSVAREEQPDAQPAIRLSIPAELRYLRLARVTAAAIAADMDFSVQDIDDVRVAVDELSALLIEDAGPGSELEICFTPDQVSITGEGRMTGGSTSEPKLHPVAAELLALVVDHYDVSVGKTGRMFRFSKQPEGGQG